MCSSLFCNCAAVAAAADGDKPASSLQTDGRSQSRMNGWRTALERVSVPAGDAGRSSASPNTWGKTGSRISSRTAVIVSKVNEEGGAAA